ncbi:MAG: hypothetical protein ABI743_05570 [bacterium]
MYRTFTVLLTLLLLALPSTAFASGLTVILLDTSRAMGERWQGSLKIEQAENQISSIVRGIPSGQKVAVIGFGGDACQPTLLLDTSDAALAITSLDAALGRVKTSGSRGLVGGLDAGLTLAEEARPDQVTFLVYTSGVDQCDESIEDLATRWNASPLTISLTGYGLDVTGQPATDLAQGMGGLGGAFQAFGAPTELTTTAPPPQQAAGNGLQLMINLPPAEDADDPDFVVAQARIEVYPAGGNTPIWQQSVTSSTFVDVPLGSYDVSARWNGETRWRRNVTIGGGHPAVVQFDFSQGVGNVNIMIGDFLDTPMPGELTVVNQENEEIVFSDSGQSSYRLSLPPGTYIATATVGEVSNEETFDVDEGDTLTIPIGVDAALGQAMISINNQDSVPVNGEILLYDAESGKLLNTWDATASVIANVASGNYEVVARVGTTEDVQTFTVTDDEQVDVEFILDVPLGSLLVRLFDTNGVSVLGTIQVFDSTGNLVPHYELENFSDSEFTFDLPAGIYSIAASSDSLTRNISGVAVTEGDENEVTIEFPSGTFGAGGSEPPIGGDTGGDAGDDGDDGDDDGMG